MMNFIHYSRLWLLLACISMGVLHTANAKHDREEREVQSILQEWSAQTTFSAFRDDAERILGITRRLCSSADELNPKNNRLCRFGQTVSEYLRMVAQRRSTGMLTFAVVDLKQRFNDSRSTNDSISSDTLSNNDVIKQKYPEFQEFSSASSQKDNDSLPKLEFASIRIDDVQSLASKLPSSSFANNRSAEEQKQLIASETQEMENQKSASTSSSSGKCSQEALKAFINRDNTVSRLLQECKDGIFSSCRCASIRTTKILLQYMKDNGCPISQGEIDQAQKAIDENYRQVQNYTPGRICP